MAPVASQLIEEVTAHAQSDSLEDAREICADGIYFPSNLRTKRKINIALARPIVTRICETCALSVGVIKIYWFLKDKF